MPPVDVTLGVTKKGRQFLLSVRTSDPKLGAAIKRKAGGEADVRILTVDARVTPSYLQGHRRPLEPGLSVSPVQPSIRSAGTLAGFVKDEAGTLYALSNSHVFADVGALPPGTPCVQPGSLDGRVTSATLIGVLDRFVPISPSYPNLVDCAIARLDGTTILPRFNAAVPGNLRGARGIKTSDLGKTVTKIGRTTGIRSGRITSIEMDGLPVNMGEAGVPRFDDQIEISGGPETDFSAAGDSGSMIIDDEGWAVGLLFAGGRDTSGEDFTYANLITNVLRLLAVRLAT